MAQSRITNEEEKKPRKEGKQLGVMLWMAQTGSFKRVECSSAPVVSSLHN
jgi:hypothetical protein